MKPTFIGRTGLIRDGEYDGYSIRIDDDRINTGGYLILVWKNNTNEGFDDWVQSEDDVDKYLLESGWTVAWSEETAQRAQL